jgi:hypothetical protein
MNIDDANWQPVPFIPVGLQAEDDQYIATVGGACNQQRRTAADGSPIATYRHHSRLFYAFSFDRKGTFVVGDAHTDQCGGTTILGDCASCHYALPSNVQTRTKILHAWQAQGEQTAWHHLENTAYVYQPCGAPSKHHTYVHGDGWEISLRTPPKS